MMPHWVLCSWRGLASFPSRPIGELMRRRWLSVDAYASRLSTYKHSEITRRTLASSSIAITRSGEGYIGGETHITGQRNQCDWEPTCETPARMPAVPCWPQLPVATEYRRPRVMVSLFTAAGTLTSLPRSTAFCTRQRTDFDGDNNTAWRILWQNLS